MVLGTPPSFLSQTSQSSFPPSGFYVRKHSSTLVSTLGAFLAPLD